MLKKIVPGFIALCAAVFLPAVSMVMPSVAVAADYSAITGAVDWEDVATAIITIVAAGALVVVAFIGAKLLIRAIKGAA